jgi:hypothetical protein
MDVTRITPCSLTAPQLTKSQNRLPAETSAHLLHRVTPALDAVDGSSPGTRVPKMWGLLKAPTIRRS